jgi:AraC family transcriptional regulator
VARYLANVAVTAAAATALPRRPPGFHPLVAEPGFSAVDCVCGHTRRSPTVEGAHAAVRVVVMLGGAFHIRSSTGDALVGAGAMVLGNPGNAYELRHVDDGGDRSIVFDYDGAVVDELDAGTGAAFRRAAVPCSPASTAAVVLAREAVRAGDAEALREAALVVADAALAFGRDRGPASPPYSGAQARRVAQTVRYIDAHSDGDCALATLAAHTGLTRFHFLRVFRALTGQTPRQHVIATRLRAAAIALRTSRAPVVDVALAAGFGDVTHFTHRFTASFGCSPRAYRNRAA